MIVTRKAHFYAAHRNERMEGSKCQRLHGHRYGLEVDFHFDTGGAVTIPFETLDLSVSPWVRLLDHRTLLHEDDRELVGKVPDALTLPFPTSAENLAAWLLAQIRSLQPAARCVRLIETDSSVVTCTLEDLDVWPTATS
jgi:6-pyruvoyl-tetrahydropterin synthase